MNYPDTYNDFIFGKWAFVVEPVMLMGDMSDNSNAYAVSYQDYLSLEIGEPMDNGHGWGMDMTQFDIACGGSAEGGADNAMYCYISNSDYTSWGYTFAQGGQNRFAMMSFFYADFEVTKADGTTVRVDTSPKLPKGIADSSNSIAKLQYISGNLKEAASTAGFAVYTDFGAGISSGVQNVSANQNFIVVPEKEMIYKSNTNADDERIIVGAEIKGSDLLTRGISTSDIKNQSLTEAEDFSGVSEFAQATAWGKDTYAEMYPRVKVFNYERKPNAWSVNSLKPVDGKAIGDDEGYDSATSKIVGGSSDAISQFINEDYYVRTFYAYDFDYTVSKTDVSASVLQREITPDTFSFYTYPDSILSSKDTDNEAEGTVYAGSKFATGIVDNFIETSEELLEAKNTSDLGVTFSEASVLVPAPRLKMTANAVNADDERSVIGKSAWNFASELSMYALANSNVRGKASEEVPFTLNQSTSSGVNSVTASVEVLCKDTKVTSYVSYGGKDKDGEVYVGKYATLDELGGATFTDKAKQSYTYSVVDAVSQETTDDVVTIDSRSQNGKPVFIVAIPNSESRGNVGAFGYALSTVDESKFYNDLFGKLEENGCSLNSVASLNILAQSLWEMAIDKDSCVIKLATSSTVEAEATQLVLGAYGGNGDEATELGGYSVYVVEDFESGKPIDCEGTLKAYELNYVYPTILCETTDKNLVTFYVAEGDNLEISKIDDYAGDIISYNAINKIALIDMVGTKYQFGNEQTNPKTFTYEDMFYKTEAIENINYKRGYEYLTHSVNLTRGMFGDAPVVSGLSPRDASLTPEQLEKMGVTSGIKGREVTGEAGEYLVGTNYDTFRWSANKGLPVMMNGQVIEVTPFGDGQSIKSAGYNLTTRAYAYIPNDRTVGEDVETGMVEDSLVVPDDGQLTYKMLTVEEYPEVLNFYPEYKMMSYVFDGDITDGESESEAKPAYVPMISDKVRRVRASGIYSMSIDASGNALTGKTLSDTVATGSEAKNLSKKFGGLQVVYAGGNVNLSAETHFGVDLGGFVLDQIDKSKDDELITAQGTVNYTNAVADNSYLKEAWGNEAYDAITEYQEWVSEVKAALAVDMSLTTSDYAGNVKKKYRGFTANVGDVEGGDITGYTSYVITFRRNTVVKDNAYNALLRAFACRYYSVDNPSNEQLSEAADLLEKSDIFKSMLSAIESYSDEDNLSSAVDAFGGEKWYDEEVRSFVIREFHTTPLTVNNILISDKIDINAGPSQTGDLFKNGYKAQWGMTLYLKTAPSTNSDMAVYTPKRDNLDSVMGSGSVLTRDVPIAGADFIISDATTADMR